MNWWNSGVGWKGGRALRFDWETVAKISKAWIPRLRGGLREFGKFQAQIKKSLFGSLRAASLLQKKNCSYPLFLNAAAMPLMEM
jgi:hypothetical protein